jgi:general secretion pathway protein G
LLFRANDGLTIVELLVVLVIISILSSLSVVAYTDALEEARVTRAIVEIRQIEKELMQHEIEGSLPDSLSDIGLGGLRDPWGNPYQYLNFSTVGNGLQGAARKDRFLVPLNSTFDLYSMGRDGKSRLPLTAQASRDDIVRAGDGGFVGLASEF